MIALTCFRSLLDGLADFGRYDIKSKSATDMYRAGVPLERIQQLLGYHSVTTTEIYIMARLPDVAIPNMRSSPAEKPLSIRLQPARSEPRSCGSSAAWRAARFAFV